MIIKKGEGLLADKIKNPAQRNAEVVDEAGSGRAVLILKGGATE